MLHAALWKALSRISIAHISRVVRCGCLLITGPQVVCLKLLTGFLLLLRAFPVAICSRASAKKSSPLLGKANGLVLGAAWCDLFFGGLSKLGQGAPGTKRVFGVDSSGSLVDNVFFDDVERLFKLSNSAYVKLGIMNLH